MALNTVKCNHLTPLGLKRLTNSRIWYGTECFGRLIFSIVRKSVGLKGLSIWFDGCCFCMIFIVLTIELKQITPIRVSFDDDLVIG